MAVLCTATYGRSNARVYNRLSERSRITDTVWPTRTIHSGAGWKAQDRGERNPLTIRHRLVVAAQTLGIPLIIKRSGSELYFWRESREEEQPRSKRGCTQKKEVGR
jgi:hypothetical protein